jgi:hypothetical protein
MNIAPEVKPEVSFVYELLRELIDGRIRAPGFQRPYVWRRDQMLDLLDSVRLQYPIGSLLLWEPSERYRTLEWIGPLRIPPEPKGSMALILDGQQRLSTLAGVLMPPTGNETNPHDDDPARWEIWFNVKEENFEHAGEGAKMEPWHFPMRKLMDTIAFLQECQRIMTDGGPEGAAWITRVQRLAQIFQSYKLAVIRIKNTNLDQAVEIFARLNAKGQRMSADQVVSALVYSESGDRVFDLSRYIDELHGFLLKSDFGDVDRTTVLRLLLACMGEDVYRTDWTKIARDKRPDIAARLTSEAQRIRQALGRALRFLQDCGVHHERLLPYAMQLVVLTSFFHSRPDPSEAQLRFVRRWFWVSSFTGWGGGTNPSRVGGLVREFTETVAQTATPQHLQNMQLNEPALPFPKAFDMRSARVRVLLLVLLSERPAGGDGTPIEEPWKLISAYGPDAVGRVANRIKEDRELVKSPANRILKSDPQNESASPKNWLLRLDDASRNQVLRSHAIPSDAFEALRDGDSAEFVRRRQQYMIDLELTFMKREGVSPPTDANAPQLAPIDADDVAPPIEPFDSDES